MARTAWVNIVVCIYFCLHFCVADVSCPPAPRDRPSLLTVIGDKCNYLVSMQPNEDDPNFLNIYLEATEPGWVAVGFSKDQHMASSDVLGCKQDANGSLAVLDTWNHKEHYPNELDPNQDGMCPYKVEYKDGRLSCLFSRYAGIINVGYDFNLDGSFYLLRGCSMTQTSVNTFFPFHTPNIPSPTADMFNPYNYNGNGSNSSASNLDFERRLIKVHGILMVIAYPLLLVTAVFFASWMKQALPKAWFHIHRVLMIISLCCSLLGFMLVFIANKDNATPGLISLNDCGTKTTHFVFGILLVTLQLINPIIAVVRCKPDSQHRWIFNLVHGSGLGLFIELIALINIALGTATFEFNCQTPTSHDTMLWLYIPWIFVIIGIHCFMFVYSTLEAVKYYQGRFADSNAPFIIKFIFGKFSHCTEYTPLTEDKSSINFENVKEMNNSVRYGTLGLQLSVTTIIVVILVVFIYVDVNY